MATLSLKGARKTEYLAGNISTPQIGVLVPIRKGGNGCLKDN